MSKKFFNGILYAAAGGLNAPGYTAMMDRFTCDAGNVIDIIRMQMFIGIGNPGHFTLARTYIRCRDIG